MEKGENIYYQDDVVVKFDEFLFEGGWDFIDFEVEKKFVWKIDLLIFFCMWIMYLLFYMD